MNNTNITALEIQAIVAETVREELAKAGLTKPAKTNLTVVEAAEMLNLSKEMIYKMVNTGKIGYSVISETPAKRTIRIPLWAVEEIIGKK